MLAVLLALALSIGVSQSDTQARDARTIATAKNISVHRLDPSLPNKTLAKWLRGVVGRQVPIAWEVNDCGEQTGDPGSDKGRDFPICVEARVTLQQESKLSISIAVGTVKTGVQPASVGLAYVVIVGPDGSARSVRKLSQLPEAIKTAG